MNTKQSVTVNLAEKYPIYKKVGDSLLLLEVANPNKRYSLTTNLQTGETYYLEYSNEEETHANNQRAEWEAGASARALEATQQADEAKKFEDSLNYETRIVAFIDILGWRNAIDHGVGNVVKALGKTLAQLKWTANHFNSLENLLPDNQKWPGNPKMTQFSDSLVISIDNNRHGKDALQNALFTITTNLIDFGFLIRGGVSRGEIYHDGSLVFGPALIESYDLERNDAIYPRVILSKELSSEWNSQEVGGALPWVLDDDGYLFFNFLPPFMGNSFFTDQQLWILRLQPIRELILKKAQDIDFPDKDFKKYIWLAKYFDKVCDEQPNLGLEKVVELAKNYRSNA